MTPANEGTWQRKPHTEGKHLVLKHYLNAWFPIMGMRNGTLLLIDGFAGPGRYEGREDGSPVVAMRTLVEHRHIKKITAKVVFFFIEEDHDVFQTLAVTVDEWRPRLPATADAHVLQGTFESSMTNVLDGLDARGQQMAPALVVIDPFGVRACLSV